ncbi:hypothetical protein RL73_00890 [Liberibacter crescens]|nr:hypothetical protein RL73_00890 [Liberibacter crescens]
MLQVIASIFGLIQIALIAKIIGVVVLERQYKVVFMVLIFFISGLMRFAIDALGCRVAFKFAYSFVSQKRQEMLERWRNISPLDINCPSSGKVASVFSEQSEMVVSYLSRFQPIALKACILPIIIFFLVLYYSWIAAFILLITAPLIPLFMILIGWHAKEASQKHLSEVGELNAMLIDRLKGLLTIRSLDAVEITAQKLRDHSENLCRRTMEVLKIAFLSSAVLELFSSLSVAMIAVYVGFSLLGQINFGAWGRQITLYEGLFILLLAPAFFEPLRELSSVWHERAAGEVALKQLETLGNRALRMVPVDHKMISCKGPPSVHLQDICFRYNKIDRLLFNKFNLSVFPGEHIALFGPSGCGKSTILSLIAGFVIPEEGHIRVGNIAINGYTILSARSRMAWVDQNPYFFSGSIKSNLRLALLEANDQQISNALKDVFLDIAPDTLIGEGGMGLSGGEALRLALARTLLKPNVDIFLIDEPTAHLDSETASFITKSLLSVTKNHTLIVSTHDIKLASLMDRVIPIEDIKNSLI